LERALSFLSNRLKKVEVVKTGQASLLFPMGYLELIFLNLFYNSLDAWTRAQHLNPKLHIDMKPGLITIHDNAGGAPEDIIKNFNSQREVTGQGLGLYLIQDAAQSVGLEVLISNAPLEGELGLRVQIQKR
jgi:C4-dicarboxylate-specific signal transduction histidine kinase